MRKHTQSVIWSESVGEKESVSRECVSVAAAKVASENLTLRRKDKCIMRI